MHSRIIQLDVLPIEKDHLVSEEDFYETEGIDYTSLLKGNQKREVLQSILTYTLPKGMFECQENEKETILIYKGGIETWKEKWLSNIKAKINSLNPKNVFVSPNLYDLKQSIARALGDTMFVMECWTGFEPQESTEFMEFVSTLKPGTKLYVGSILDYHF